jgi:hypothetical protein
VSACECGGFTKETVLGFTPVSGTETTSSPRLADAVLVTILVLVFTSEDSLDDVAGVITLPFLPKLYSPPGHWCGEQGLDSGSGKGGDSERKDGDEGSVLHLGVDSDGWWG